jgi:hypothetical protein
LVDILPLFSSFYARDLSLSRARARARERERVCERARWRRLFLSASLLELLAPMLPLLLLLPPASLQLRQLLPGLVENRLRNPIELGLVFRTVCSIRR